MSTHREVLNIKVWHINTVERYGAIGKKCSLSRCADMDRLPGDTVVLLAQHALPSPCLLTDPRFSSGHHPLPKAAHATQALVNPCIPLEILNVKILRERRKGWWKGRATHQKVGITNQSAQRTQHWTPDYRRLQHFRDKLSSSTLHIKHSIYVWSL